MAGDIYFNGSKLTGQHDVKLNGTDMDNVYLNGTKLWTRHPYAIGTEIFTYSVGAGGNSDNLRTTFFQTYPLAFDAQPNYIEGSGGAQDSRLNFNLAAGFYVSFYSQAELGTDSDGTGASNTGGSHVLYVGGTVSGLSSGFSISSSGNGGTTFKVTYSGQ